MCACACVCQGKLFKEGGYFSVLHRKVLWVNVDGECAVLPGHCAWAYIHAWAVAWRECSSCHCVRLWGPQRRVTVGVGVGDTCCRRPLHRQRKHMHVSCWVLCDAGVRGWSGGYAVGRYHCNCG